MNKDRKKILAEIEEKKRQYELALNGDAEMLILLGKKYLGQTDNGIIEPDKPDKKRKL